MKHIYKVTCADRISSEILAEFSIDDDDVVSHSVNVCGSENKIVISMEGSDDFIIDFHRRIAIERTEETIDDFYKTYTISIGDELVREQIMNDLLDKGVEWSVANNVASNIDYTDIDVEVTVSVCDLDVQLNHVNI